MTIDQVINKVKENDPKADLILLKLAYDFAEKAHRGQKRMTGESYIQHCLHTAFLLAQMKSDLTTIIAGLLHDVPEDTDIKIEEIEKNFGADTANLVKGITKLGKIKYRGVERYRENLRKMFLAMAEDLRVILIKFCDRMHNLRTLEALPEEKRIRIARETLEIYAPIAGLLGIWRLKWQMEDLCFKYIHPDEYKKILYKYEIEKKVERTQYIQKIKNVLGQKLKENNIEYRIEGRFKHLYSIYKKMQLKDRKFDEILDVFALRIIVTSIPDCYKTLGTIHTIWKPKAGRIKDYIAVPKPNGYRSLHTTVFGPDNKATEFQIRTNEMNEEALYGIAAHWYYKQKEGSDYHEEKQPAWVKEILSILRQENNDKDFIKEIKLDIFRDRIFVFSPKGDVFDLPEDATPIDFAYAVHTEIGNKTTGALVNNKMVSLEHPLKNGDLVEVIIEKQRKGPSRDWLKFVKTHRAKEKIIHFTKESKFEQFKKIFPKI